MQNLDCSICGSTSFTEVGGLPVCEDCFYSIQENDFSNIEVNVKSFYKSLTMDDVEIIVCDHHNVSPKKAMVKKRTRDLVIVRQLCHHFSKEMNLGSLNEIGHRFGKKDHATVLYSDRTIKNLKETDKVFRKVYDELLEKL